LDLKEESRGKIVAQGSVMDIIENSESYTGQWLKKKLRE
jgi:excinuclease UvrABC ATPase subunit